MSEFKAPDYSAEVQDYLDTFGTATDPKLARRTLHALLLIVHEKGFKEGLQCGHEIWSNAINQGTTKKELTSV
jgi:hypothetical protein